MATRKPDAAVPGADDPAQSQRFIDMARELGADEEPEAFERALGKVIKSGRTVADAPKPESGSRTPR